MTLVRDIFDTTLHPKSETTEGLSLLDNACIIFPSYAFTTQFSSAPSFVHVSVVLRFVQHPRNIKISIITLLMHLLKITEAL
jgi:hypothetical protein